MVLIYPTFLHQILHKKFTRLYRNLYMGHGALGSVLAIDSHWPFASIQYSPSRLFNFCRGAYCVCTCYSYRPCVRTRIPCCIQLSQGTVCTVVPSQPNSQSAVVIGGGNGWRTTACAPSSAPGPDRSSARVCLLTELCVAFVPAPTQPTVNGYGLGRNL